MRSEAWEERDKGEKATSAASRATWTGPRGASARATTFRDLTAVVARKDAIVRQWREGVEKRLRRAGDRLVFREAHARFVGEREIELQGERHGAETIIITRAQGPRNLHRASYRWPGSTTPRMNLARSLSTSSSWGAATPADGLGQMLCVSGPRVTRRQGELPPQESRIPSSLRRSSACSVTKASSWSLARPSRRFRTPAMASRWRSQTAESSAARMFSWRQGAGRTPTIWAVTTPASGWTPKGSSSSTITIKRAPAACSLWVTLSTSPVHPRLVG